jgi:tRNA(fMet)-specific endonuclease VapC
MRGWLAAIRRKTDVRQQPFYYDRLIGLVDYFCRWRILAFDDAAADCFAQLRQSGIRIGTMDLEIAAITLSAGATLWSANLRHFEQVPDPIIANRLA